MQIISGTSEFQLNKPSAIAIGKFDGIHLGHQLLVDKIKKASKAKNLQSVVFTFNPSPESFFSRKQIPELTTCIEKRCFFERMGIDVLIEFPLNSETAATPPDVFVRDYIHNQMMARYIAAGRDISFGDRGLGDAKLLEAYAKEYNYELAIVDKVTFEGADISSTRIREAIKIGDMNLANSLLGSPYKISGIVAHGRRLGTTLGMPTANVIIPSDKLVGPKGVYISRVITKGGTYASISNVGVKPTISDTEKLCVESYLYDFSADIYDEYIEVELLEYSRQECKFSSLDELKAQVLADIEAGRKYHEDKK